MSLTGLRCSVAEPGGKDPQETAAPLDKMEAGLIPKRMDRGPHRCQKCKPQKGKLKLETTRNMRSGKAHSQAGTVLYRAVLTLRQYQS